MYQNNSTTTTTDAPLTNTTTVAKGNRTLSQKSTSPRSATTTATTYTAKMAPGVYSLPKDEDSRIAIIGICTAATLLIVILLVVALIILKKRRDQKGSTENIEDGKKNNNVVLKHSNTIMNDITSAVAKRQKCVHEEYDDVVSTDKDKDGTAQSDDLTDKEEYDYVMVKRTSPQPYTILGPRDTPDTYELMQKNSSDKDKNSLYCSIKYKNWTANQGENLETKALYENQVEIIKDGYIVPIKKEENRDRSPSEDYLEVLA